jgi:hypothetical protein
MQFTGIVLFSIAAAVFYGIVHDQVSARVCLEYFTIGHPPVFKTTSPTLLALGWGVIATWWIGLPLGIFLACASRLGTWPRLTARDLVRPTLVLVLVMGLFAVFFGWRGYVRAEAGTVKLPPALFAAVPLDKHGAFIADWFAHTASYAVGTMGGFSLCFWTLRKRWRAMKNK